MSSSVKSQLLHRSREIALQLIYQFDLRPDADMNTAFELYPREGEDESVFAHACEITKGVLKNKETIGDMLAENIVGWRPERMVAVDRVIISIALYEAIISKTVPVPVAVSEAVELAKAFGTNDSSRFVNGVLGKIVRKADEQK